MGACERKAVSPHKNLQLQAFNEFKADEYALDSLAFRENLEHLLSKDKDSAFADFRARDYYRNGGATVWVNRRGVDCQADTLLGVLKETVADMGFSNKAFAVSQIEQDLLHLKLLDFDRADNDISLVMARLEYNLTKAFLRYAIGQRFGFVDPYTLFNRLFPTATDSLGRPLDYQVVFDVEMQRAWKGYDLKALGKVAADSVAVYLREIQPVDTLYDRLKDMLDGAKGQERMKLLCNMERRRWRVDSRPDPKSKYVIVNVPAYHLWAVSPDTVVDMRVVCGALKSRTPLLTSKITTLIVNPEWVIPMSIIRTDIAGHAGDPTYFVRRGYYIAERATNKRLATEEVTAEQLLSGRLKVVQNSGPGNSLGRMLFRFNNKFNVFLHDTSTRGHFMSENRGVSHGCVRVQHPFDLSAFLLDKTDEWLLDKIRISIDMEPESDKGREYMEREDRPDHPRLVGNLPISPRVPLYITYYTIYPTPDGRLQYYPDVYGYDHAMEKVLKLYTD